MDSCPGQKGHGAVGVTATVAARLNEIGRFARSVAIDTQRWVIRSWRSWGIAVLGACNGSEAESLTDARKKRRDRLELRQRVTLEAFKDHRRRALSPPIVVVARLPHDVGADERH